MADWGTRLAVWIRYINQLNTLRLHNDNVTQDPVANRAVKALEHASGYGPNVGDIEMCVIQSFSLKGTRDVA